MVKLKDVNTCKVVYVCSCCDENLSHEDFYLDGKCPECRKAGKPPKIKFIIKE